MRRWALLAGTPVLGIFVGTTAIAVVAAIQSFVTAVQRERQEILGELIQRHIQERVLEVATAVDLLAFGDSFGDSVYGLVDMIFRKWATAPFKKPNQFAADFKILFTSAVAVFTEPAQQSVKCLLS